MKADQNGFNGWPSKIRDNPPHPLNPLNPHFLFFPAIGNDSLTDQRVATDEIRLLTERGSKYPVQSSH